MSQFRNDKKRAVALKYDDVGNAAPVIVASGMGHMAEKIVEVAEKNNIAVYEDNSLATLLTQLDLGSEIPEELYKTIVDIYVYFLNYSLDSKDSPDPKPEKEKVDNISDPNPKISDFEATEIFE